MQYADDIFAHGCTVMLFLVNVYTHIGFDDAEEKLNPMEEFGKVQAEIEQKKEKPMSQKMFKVI